jgi:hypothetical protein
MFFTRRADPNAHQKLQDEDEPGVLVRTSSFKQTSSLLRTSSFGRRRTSNTETGTLRVVLVAGRDLPAMDKSGLSDPYVILQLTHGLTRVKRKSSVQQQTLNPRWNHVFEFERVPPEAKLTLDLWDKDRLNSDYIGKLVLPVSEMPFGSAPLARWLALPRGEVLVEVQYGAGGAQSDTPASPPPRSIEIAACTWNVGNAFPPTADELGGEWLECGTADLVAVGAQECSFKQVPEGCSSSAEFWFGHVHEALGGERRFEMLSACSLGQMHLALLCSHALLPFVSKVEFQSEATGIGHVVGNKGGLAISCEVAGTSMCFVSAHLAAHQDEAERRASDFAEIEGGIRLCKAKRPVDLSNRFDFLCWMGDLNYRLELEREAVLAAVRARDWPVLRARDQLLAERAKGTAFAGFAEGELAFPPTFKHVHGQGPRAVAGGAAQREYEEKKARVPSWCDRVLWREWPGRTPAAVLAYESFPNVATSDHSPVRALLNVALPPPIERSPSAEASEQFTLVLSGIRASQLLKTDVGVNASADPYVRVLLADGMAIPVSTSVKRRTLEPRWDESLTVHVPWAYTSADALRAAHLLISVMDADKLSADDSIGHCSIALGVDWPVRVRTNITRRGCVSGELEMVVHVRRQLVGPLQGDWPQAGRRPSVLERAAAKTTSADDYGLHGPALDDEADLDYR